MLRGRGKFCSFIVAAMATSLLVAVAPLGAGGAGAAERTPYYLALGDSLAQGVQPNSTGQSVVTDQGYVDDLYSLYSRVVPNLKLAKLGCPGETTTSMIKGGVCTYPLGSQLAQALAFLQTHRVVLVTIDIGANNVDGCLASGTPDLACIGGGLSSIGTDLPQIMGAIKANAPGIPVVGMNYYDPFLAEWLLGPAGQTVATESLGLAGTLNGTLDSIYGAFGDRVADVARAFLTNDTTPFLFTGVPIDVIVICALTWMCAPSPVGPNIHANAAGYAVIAGAFAKQVPVVSLARRR
jgi:lysophospholipase L1-like esterase